jgi:hypothetical protein
MMQGEFKNWSVMEMLKAFYREWNGMRKKHEEMRDNQSRQEKDTAALWKSHEQLRLDVANLKEKLESNGVY